LDLIQSKVTTELQKEKARASSLEVEQQTPINVHRWRLLQGQDPERHELMQKVESLQEIIRNKNRQIAQKEEQMDEAKQIQKKLEPDVTRQANADHQKQIREYQRRIERLDKELKVEIAHNNSTRAALESFASEKELKDEEIKKWKQMYFDMKRRASHNSNVSSGEMASLAERRRQSLGDQSSNTRRKLNENYVIGKDGRPRFQGLSEADHHMSTSMNDVSRGNLASTISVDSRHQPIRSHEIGNMSDSYNKNNSTPMLPPIKKFS